MNNESPKLRHTQKQESIAEESVAEEQQQQNPQTKEFFSVEELLREDSAQTAVPPGIAVKLNQSIAKSPKTKAWWQQFFSRE